MKVKESGILVGTTNTSKVLAEGPSLQQKNLNILGLPNMEGLP